MIHGSPMSNLEAEVAERYAKDGFKVILNPAKDELPFDLGPYTPDLIAVKSPDKNYIIEIRNSKSPFPVDRMEEIANRVKKNSGWRFLVVTEKDEVGTSEQKELFNLSEIRRFFETANDLQEKSETEEAFIVYWIGVEGLLRRIAIEAGIPIERLPTRSLVDHLYSKGELTFEQYDQLRSLFLTRNAIVHGVKAVDIELKTRDLKATYSSILANQMLAGEFR
ncbi:hypothetical protein [Lacunimicrobium album]